jgi:hypothetical protein
MAASAQRREAPVEALEPAPFSDLVPDPLAAEQAASPTAQDVQQQGLGNAVLAARAEAGGMGGGLGGGMGGGGAPAAGAGEAALAEKDATGAGGGAGGGGGAPAAANEAGGGDAAATEAAPAEGEAAAAPAAGGGDAIQILSASLPADSAAAFTSAQAAAASEVETERTDLAENPPSMEAPSGLVPGEPAQEGEGEGGSGEPEAAAGIEDQQGEGDEPPPMDTSHEASEGPVPAGPPVGPVVDQAPEDPAARVEAYRRLLFAMPTSDEDVDTSAGPAPGLELTADADPGQYAGQEGENETILAGENETARLDMQADEGVDAIFPTLPDAMLVAPIAGGAGAMDEFGEMEVPPLTADVIGGVNQGAAAQWDTATTDAAVQREQGQLDRQVKETEERARVEGEISGLEQAAAEEQLGHRATARGEVETARTAWRGELDEARGTYDTERTSVRDKLDSDVVTQVEQAEGEAEGHLADGEAQAELRREEAETEAADKRAEAERQSEEEDDGFFGWVASKVKSFFKALQSALKAVFNALRKAVEIIIEGAKKLAAAAIELGRMAVVGFIKLAGAALELAADVFLAAFPEARDRAKAAIRAGVATAEEAVNRAAEALREGVFALLDGLGKVLTAIIDAYEAIYSAIFKALEFLVLGMIEVMKGLYRLGLSAKASPGEMEGQIYEEMLGADLTQPLPFELTEADVAKLASGEVGAGEELAGIEGLEGPGGPEMGGPAPTDVEMDQVAPLELDPEMDSQIPQVDGEEIEFGENADPDNTLAAIHAELGYTPAGATVQEAPAEAAASPEAEAAAPEAGVEDQEAAPQTDDEKLDAMIAKGGGEHNCQTEAPTSQEGPDIPISQKFGPLSKSQRARYMMAQAWTGIKQWLSCNWGKVLLAVIGAIAVVAAIVAAVVLSGGTVGAALGGIMAVLGPLIGGAMIVVAIARIFSYLGDWVTKSWGGDISGGAKALARVAAIAAVEIIFAVLTYLTAGAFRILSSAVKATGRAVAGAAKGAAKLAKQGLKAGGKVVKSGLKSGGKAIARGGAKLARVGGRAGAFVVRQGKIVMQGVRKGFARGAKSLKDLGRRLGSKLRFRRFKIVRRGRRLQIWGQINPWVLLADGKIERIDDLPEGTEVGDLVAVPGRTQKGIVVGIKTRSGGGAGAAKALDYDPAQVAALRAESKAAKIKFHQDNRGKTSAEIRAALDTGGETARNARILAGNMKGSPHPGRPAHKPGDHAHHLVPSTDGRGAAAKKILEGHGIDINSSANGLFLDATTHGSVHTTAGYAEITKLLSPTKNAAEAIKVLDDIAARILAKTFP